MYIRKSVISRIIMTVGACILAVLTVLFSFTEVEIPHMVYAVVWLGSIAAVTELVQAVERSGKDL